MKILIFWDIYWRIWRKALIHELPYLKRKYNPDFIIANVDNITSWRGAIEKHILEIEKAWVDIMTWWDHIIDNLIKVKDYIWKKDSKLLMCANFYKEVLIWKWYGIYEKNWKKLLVIHLQWDIFMNHKVDNPFKKAREIIDSENLEGIDWIIVDFHRETTSEIYGLANYLDWEISFIYGTHTHIQTNDDIILKWWTWILSDVWMNWPLNSVIGASFESVKKRFLTWINRWKIEQELSSDYVVSWVFVEIGEDKLCSNIEKIRIKWKLV